MYVKFDTDKIKYDNLINDQIKTNITISKLPSKDENIHKSNIDSNKMSHIKKKLKSADNDKMNECGSSIKKRVTFAADVKSEKDDQKCTAGNMKPLSLNKRKKINYLKKLKAKKNKKKMQKNVKKTLLQLLHHVKNELLNI